MFSLRLSWLVGDRIRSVSRFILSFVVLFDFLEPLFFQFLLNHFHLFFFFFLLLLSLNSLLFLLLLFLFNLSQIFHKTRIPLFHIREQIFDCLDIGLLLSLSLLFILFLHLSSDPSAVGIPCVPLLTPNKGLVSGKIFPIFVKF